MVFVHLHVWRIHCMYCKHWWISRILLGDTTYVGESWAVYFLPDLNDFLVKILKQSLFLSETIEESCYSEKKARKKCFLTGNTKSSLIINCTALSLIDKIFPRIRNNNELLWVIKSVKCKEKHMYQMKPNSKDPLSWITQSVNPRVVRITQLLFLPQ